MRVEVLINELKSELMVLVFGAGKRPYHHDQLIMIARVRIAIEMKITVNSVELVANTYISNMLDSTRFEWK